jgi:hypothetical protein
VLRHKSPASNTTDAVERPITSVFMLSNGLHANGRLLWQKTAQLLGVTNGSSPGGANNEATAEVTRPEQQFTKTTAELHQTQLTLHRRFGVLVWI